jgi:nitrile hydratase accessory protein
VNEDPVFSEPWEAQAFALVVSLHDRGLFTWDEWAEALGAETRRSNGPADYAAWLTAVEALLAARGITSDNALAERRAAFARAATATPHGQPILLSNDPEFAG